MRTKRSMPELSSGSLADIAFLLLTFYMITTVIHDNKGLALLLPPYQNEPISIPIPSRNLFTIHINSQNRYMVEDQEVESVAGLRAQIKDFILNNGRDVLSSDNPEKAVVSIQTNRGTSYRAFLHAVDEAQAAYYEIYADRAGVTATEFRQFDLTNPSNKKLYDKARRGVPMNISIAEPKVAME